MRRARGSCRCAFRGVPAPPGIVMVASPEVPRNAEGAGDVASTGNYLCNSVSGGTLAAQTKVASLDAEHLTLQPRL